MKSVLQRYIYSQSLACVHEKYVYIIVQIYIIFYFSTDYFLVKYVSDAILSIKEDDLEHEIITDRTEFWVDDIVMCYWDDMEKYPARIIAVGRKFIHTLNQYLTQIKAGFFDKINTNIYTIRHASARQIILFKYYSHKSKVCSSKL